MKLALLTIVLLLCFILGYRSGSMETIQKNKLLIEKLESDVSELKTHTEDLAHLATLHNYQIDVLTQQVIK